MSTEAIGKSTFNSLKIFNSSLVLYIDNTFLLNLFAHLINSFKYFKISLEKISPGFLISTDKLSRLYEIASLVRFNYGLDYEIFSLTSNFDQKVDENEVSLHNIRLVDHTYENKFTNELPKSRGFFL